jgi:uncharacterized NAD(P)/FAD-binding protein YdhS
MAMLLAAHTVETNAKIDQSISERSIVIFERVRTGSRQLAGLEHGQFPINSPHIIAHRSWSSGEIAMRGCQRMLELFDMWDARGQIIALAELIESLKGLDLNRSDLDEVLTFNERTYGRASIWRRPNYEALVLCWKSGQRSPIHDHAGSSCAVRVIEGRATETRFVKSPCGRLVPHQSRTFSAGAVTGCRDSGTHQMANLEPPGRDLITLHVYSPPPASNWRFYSLDATTLADHDRLIADRPETLVVDLGETLRRRHNVVRCGCTERGRSVDSGPVIAIVGGGFSGAMVAVHLARVPGPGPARVLLFEKAERKARGLAYGTRCDQHLLNVPAGLMSALPDQPAHFLDWLRARDASAHDGTFAPRRVYGDYLEELLTAAAAGSTTPITFVSDEVVDMEVNPGDGCQPLQLTTRRGNRFAADRVVLALGHTKPQNPRELERQALPEEYISDPWSPRALEGVAADDAIALIGTGLTAVDLIVQARTQGHRGTIYAVSRHGLLPCRHRNSAAVVQHPKSLSAPVEEVTTARGLLRWVRSEAALCQTGGGDWRSVVDALRPLTHSLWRALNQVERQRFIRHLACRWDVHRHRVAPQIDDQLHEARRAGRLVVLAGRVVALARRDGMTEVSFRRRGSAAAETVWVRRVINCTGPARDIRAGSSDLVQSLIARGIGRPGPLALGLDVGDSGALIDQDGREQHRILAIGPLLKERLWETTAARELRTQALDLARKLVVPVGIDRRVATDISIAGRANRLVTARFDPPHSGSSVGASHSARYSNVAEDSMACSAERALPQSSERPRAAGDWRRIRGSSQPAIAADTSATAIASDDRIS